MRIVVKKNMRTMRIFIIKEFIQGERVPYFSLLLRQTGANGWLGTWSSKRPDGRHCDGDDEVIQRIRTRLFRELGSGS